MELQGDSEPHFSSPLIALIGCCRRLQQLRMWPRLARLAGVSAGVGSQICWVLLCPKTGTGSGLTPEPRLIGAGPFEFWREQC